MMERIDKLIIKRANQPSPLRFLGKKIGRFLRFPNSLDIFSEATEANQEVVNSFLNLQIDKARNTMRPPYFLNKDNAKN